MGRPGQECPEPAEAEFTEDEQVAVAMHPRGQQVTHRDAFCASQGAGKGWTRDRWDEAVRALEEREAARLRATTTATNLGGTVNDRSNMQRCGDFTASSTSAVTPRGRFAKRAGSHNRQIGPGGGEEAADAAPTSSPRRHRRSSIIAAERAAIWSLSQSSASISGGRFGLDGPGRGGAR